LDIGSLANWVTVFSVPVSAYITWLAFYVPYCHNELSANPHYRLARASTLSNPNPWRFYIDFLSAGLAFLDRLMGRPSSFRALGVCITLALVYGIASLLVAWVLGAPRALGDTVLLPEGVLPWSRRLLVLAMAVWILCAVLLLRTDERIESAVVAQFRQLLLRLVPRASPAAAKWLYRVVAALAAGMLLAIASAATGFLALAAFPKAAAAALLFAAAGGLAWMIAPARGDAFERAGFGLSLAALIAAAVLAVAGMKITEFEPAAFLAALPLSVCLVVAFAGAGAAALLVAAAVAGAFVVAAFAGGGIVVLVFFLAVFLAAGPTIALFFSVDASIVAATLSFAGPYAVVWAAALLVGVILGSSGLGVESTTLLLFFLILPLINGVWNWCSWGISRWFGRRLLGTIQTTAPWWRKARIAVSDVLGDLVATFGFTLALAFTLPTAIEACNSFGFAVWGARPLDLTDYLDQAAARPWTEGFWAAFILLSVFLPTFLHFSAALATLLLSWFYPTEGRIRLAAALSAPEPTLEQAEAYRRAVWYFSFYRPLFYLAAGSLFAFLVWGMVRLTGYAERVPQIMHSVARAGIETTRAVLALVG
jgi:hypothetical protein